ncbi:MAG: hypothetical protein EKK46_16975 [Rhodocyclaceae bacterium]|nr:MAG: hypothetical protein EKK46_16975 [Rhodocyclaceae bacterium]
MNSRLSALLDGELEQDGLESLCASLRRHDAHARHRLSEDAHAYTVIGAVLRKEGALGGTNLASRIMAALEDEPVVLAPRRSALSGWKRPAFALAASVAGVMIVAAVVLTPQQRAADAGSVALAQRSQAVEQAKAPKQLAAAEMQEYLIAHQAQSMGTYLGAGSQQIRTVSLMEESAAK